MTILKDQFQTNFPFITCVKSKDIEYIGIILNSDASILSMYDYASLRNDVQRQKILELGEIWWWESNRKIPISIFLKKEMIIFRDYIKTFNSKDIEILFGPIVNLSEIAEKRVKRKSIQLVRNIKKVK